MIPQSETPVTVTISGAKFLRWYEETFFYLVHLFCFDLHKFNLFLLRSCTATCPTSNCGCGTSLLWQELVMHLMEILSSDWLIDMWLSANLFLSRCHCRTLFWLSNCHKSDFMFESEFISPCLTGFPTNVNICRPSFQGQWVALWMKNSICFMVIF